jgi:hypothetical protein
VSKVPGRDLQDVRVGRGGVGGEGVAPPRGRVGGVLQQLLDKGRVPQVALLPQHLPSPLHLHGTRVRQRHTSGADGSTVERIDRVRQAKTGVDWDRRK